MVGVAHDRRGSFGKFVIAVRQVFLQTRQYCHHTLQQAVCQKLGFIHFGYLSFMPEIPELYSEYAPFRERS